MPETHPHGPSGPETGWGKGLLVQLLVLSGPCLGPAGFGAVGADGWPAAGVSGRGNARAGGISRNYSGFRMAVQGVDGLKFKRFGYESCT